MRRLWCLLTISWLLIPVAAFAMRLGEIKLHSALYQPLHAEVELLDLHNIPLKDIQAGVASADDFNKMGIERSSILNKLKFHFSKNKSGQSTIVITSHGVINEPYLNFLIDVHWPNGQLFRAYTILLDPPDYNQQLTKDTAVADQTPATAEASAVLPEPKTTLNPEIEKTYGPIAKTDSLWRITNKLRTDRSITPQQLMMALVSVNPQAFIDNNINRVKAGATLQVPSVTAILTIPQALAEQEVQRQNKAWQDFRQGLRKNARVANPVPFKLSPITEATPDVAAKPATSENTQVPNSQRDAAQLTNTAPLITQHPASPANAIVSSANVNSDATAKLPILPPKIASEATSQANTSEIVKLQSPATVGLEKNAVTQTIEPNSAATPNVTAIDSSEAEKNLRAELAIAAEALNTAKQANQMLQLRLQQIEQQNKELQAQLAKKMPRAMTTPTVSTHINTVQQTKTKVSQATTTGSGSAAAVVRETSNIGWLNALLGILVILFIVLSGWLAWRRNWLKKLPLWDLLQSKLTAIQGTKSAPTSTRLEPVVAKPETIQKPVAQANLDPLDQANVYMTYNRYPQAEATLLAAVQAQPERLDLWLRLLDVYAALKDQATFDNWVKKIPVELKNIDPNLTEKIQKMRNTTWPPVAEEPKIVSQAAVPTQDNPDISMSGHQPKKEELIIPAAKTESTTNTTSKDTGSIDFEPGLGKDLTVDRRPSPVDPNKNNQ